MDSEDWNDSEGAGSNLTDEAGDLKGTDFFGGSNDAAAKSKKKNEVRRGCGAETPERRLAGSSADSEDSDVDLEDEKEKSLQGRLDDDSIPRARFVGSWFLQTTMTRIWTRRCARLKTRRKRRWRRACGAKIRKEAAQRKAGYHVRQRRQRRGPGVPAQRHEQRRLGCRR